MSIFLESKSIYYDDINLIAQPQRHISSRAEIPEQIDDFIVSPMAAVVGKKFALKAVKLGLGVCLHRFDEPAKQRKILYALYDEHSKEDVEEWNDVWVSVGLNDLDRAKFLGHKSVLVDVANGYLSEVVRFANELRRLGYRVMVGNVHSAKGINLYDNCRIRVGIGNSKVCKTGEVTGYTRGQVTEILECVRDRLSSDQMIVADGGIKGPGEAAKAFGLGADFCMLGGYWSVAEEAENVVNGEYRYWGGASHIQQIKQHGKVRRHAEGREVGLDKKQVRPLETLVKDLWGGVASAISYSGHANLTQFRGNGVFELKK